ncbi:hypothetical protein C0995_003568, partial [Termitomyces sp. Mi166
MAGETLEEAFKDGYVHFTPFVKAAIQDYWNMPKADLVIPVCICRDANPTRWCMTAVFIQVKNRVDEQPILIDAQRTFGFFTKSTTKEYNERPYITIAMELGMLTPEQRKAPQPQPQSKAKPVSTVKGKQGSKGKGKEHETAMPATPERNLAPQVPLSPAQVKVTSRLHEQTLRGPQTHPRYEILIRGCSKR